MVKAIGTLYNLQAKYISPIYNTMTLHTLKKAIPYTDKAYDLLLVLSSDRQK